MRNDEGILAELPRVEEHAVRLLEAFPSNLVASMFGFEPAAYVEVTDLAARRPPSVAG